MPVGSETILVGSYTVTFNSVALGIFVGEDGYPTVTQKHLSKPVGPTSKYGRAKIDSVHLGFDYQWSAVLMEAGKGMAALTMGYNFGEQGLIGALKYTLAQALVMTAVAGLTASASPATLTANKAVLADDHQGRLVYGPTVRELALMLDLLPYILTGSTVGNFVLA